MRFTGTSCGQLPFGIVGKPPVVGPPAVISVPVALGAGEGVFGAGGGVLDAGEDVLGGVAGVLGAGEGLGPGVLGSLGLNIWARGDPDICNANTAKATSASPMSTIFLVVSLPCICALVPRQP